MGEANLLCADSAHRKPNKRRYCFPQEENARFYCGFHQTDKIMSSPVTAASFDLQNFSGDVCERLKKLLELNNTLKEFFTWFLDEDGNPSDAFLALLSSVATPIGGIVFYPTSSVPSGYLHANGQAVSRTTYANLFAVYGTTFGTGDGSTTFNLPNMQDKFPMGSSASALPGSTGGAAAVALTQAQLPSVLTNLNQDMHNFSEGGLVAMGTFKPMADDTSEGGAVINSLVLPNLNNPGGGQAHANIPPYFAGLWLVKH